MYVLYVHARACVHIYAHNELSLRQVNDGSIRYRRTRRREMPGGLRLRISEQREAGLMYTGSLYTCMCEYLNVRGVGEMDKGTAR